MGDDDILHWQALIFGPDDTPWEGGTFKLELKFTEEYPVKAPTVKFVTKMFHPNIYANGAICLDILQHNWSPIYDISAILTSIQSLLTDPNPNSPANVEAAKLYQENRREMIDGSRLASRRRGMKIRTTTRVRVPIATMRQKLLMRKMTNKEISVFGIPTGIPVI